MPRVRKVVAVVAALACMGAGAALAADQGSGPAPNEAGGRVDGTVSASPERDARGSEAPSAWPTARGDDQTHPRVLPRRGTRNTRYVLYFTLRQAAGHQGVIATAYRIAVDAPRGADAACRPPASASVEEGEAGQIGRVALAAPEHGWCVGRHRVGVLLERGPHCPPPQDGRPPPPCPMFPTRILDVGEAHFSVRRAPSR
jgi:hypothetical protein